MLDKEMDQCDLILSDGLSFCADNEETGMATANLSKHKTHQIFPAKNILNKYNFIGTDFAIP